jgi:hypothetical protein
MGRRMLGMRGSWESGILPAMSEGLWVRRGRVVVRSVGFDRIYRMTELCRIKAL